MKYFVISQTKVWLASCPRSTGQDRKEPTCYIHLKRVGDVSSCRNEFWAKMTGDDALLIFKPGQEVEVELSFHVKKNARKHFQRVCVEKISLVKASSDSDLVFPW